MKYERHGLLSIGGFASVARLSIKALRLYEQLGLLTPATIDRESGYRYYHTDQLHLARLIRIMRQMEMPLATIRQILAATPQAAAGMVDDYWKLRETRMQQARRLIPTLIAALQQEGSFMALDIQVKTVEAQPVISITRRVKVEQLDEHIRSSLVTLRALAEQHGQTPAGPGLGIYHGPVNQEDDGPMEVCLPVHESFSVTGEVNARILAGGQLASVQLAGEQCVFPAILAGYDAVYDWIRQNGFETLEPPREIWHRPPGPDEQIEVAWMFG